ncbi:MAG TPA: DUF4129 domain-containing protein [Candidatus Limnocylindrales bacterium]|nr:DUF4129 domain-containing protein [Candidatus Limnocylindrales bacterium]
MTDEREATTERGGIGAARAVAAIVELAPVAFVVIAEAAWISVVSGLLQEFSRREPVLGVPALVPFVVVGIVAAAVLAPRLDARWPFAALGFVAVGVLAGTLASPDARADLGAGPGAAMGAHLGGWAAGLAVLRGFAHARLPLAEGTVSRLLGIGVPGLAIAALLGGAIGEPYRARFLADALGASIVFMAAAVLALAFARLGAVGSDGGFDWRRNPAWLGLTILLLVAAIVVALPLSAVAGTAISVLVSVALGPLFVIGLATGLDRAARRVLGFMVVAVVIAFLLARGPGAILLPDPAPPGTGGQAEPSPVEQMVTVSLGSLLLLAAVIGVLILVALWMRRVRPPDDGVLEERTIDAGGTEPDRRRRRNRFGRRVAPDGAAAAYVALMDDLARHPDVLRDPAETPIEHAARLRAIGRSDLSLDLLAADYALARYGGVSLPAREDRRAVRRWQVLRRRLVIRPPGWVVPGEGAGDAPDGTSGPPLDVGPRRTM